MPFILRGVGVLGMDSEKMPIGPRRELWKRVGDSLTPQHLSAVSHGDRDIVKARLFQATSKKVALTRPNGRQHQFAAIRIVNVVNETADVGAAQWPDSAHRRPAIAGCY